MSVFLKQGEIIYRLKDTWCCDVYIVLTLSHSTIFSSISLSADVSRISRLVKWALWYLGTKFWVYFLCLLFFLFLNIYFNFILCSSFVNIVPFSLRICKDDCNLQGRQMAKRSKGFLFFEKKNVLQPHHQYPGIIKSPVNFTVLSRRGRFDKFKKPAFWHENPTVQSFCIVWMPSV